MVFKEFKAFVMRGNVLDLAVAVVLGAAFGAVVTSFVDNILLNLVSAFGNAPDFSRFAVTVSGSTIRYGAFVNDLVAFVIIAFAVFLVVRSVNRLTRRGAEPAESVKTCRFCATNIPEAATRCPACTSDLAEKPARTRSRR